MNENHSVSLRPLTENDTANIVKWRNSDSVRKNLYTQTILTSEQHLNYYRNTVQAGKCVQYIISVIENGKNLDIGTAFIKNIDWANRKGEFGMFIGENSFRGKGYAAPVVQKILEIAFSKLMLHRVYLSVMADNVPAIKTYERAGFLREGRLQDDYLRNDGFIDIIVMGITEPLWRKKMENS